MIYDNEARMIFRDADADGMVGLRAYMNHFQDMATEFSRSTDKGNAVIAKQYGVIWVYAKFRVHIIRAVPIGDVLKMYAWYEPPTSAKHINTVCVFEDDQGPVFEGRLENSLLSIAKQHSVPLSDIDYDADSIVEHRTVDIKPFRRIKRSVEGLEPNYVRIVRYADLDANGHMNNRRYIEMFVNVFDRAFYQHHRIVDFEIHYLRQCFEGEHIQVFASCEGNKAHLAATTPDGTVVTVAIMEFAPID